jgi:hypothetical protein
MCCFRWCGRQLCLRNMPISGVDLTPRTTAVYASDPALPRRPQDSVPACPLRRWPDGTLIRMSLSAFPGALPSPVEFEVVVQSNPFGSRALDVPDWPDLTCPPRNGRPAAVPSRRGGRVGPGAPQRIAKAQRSAAEPRSCSRATAMRSRSDEMSRRSASAGGSAGIRPPGVG